MFCLTQPGARRFTARQRCARKRNAEPPPGWPWWIQSAALLVQSSLHGVAPQPDTRSTHRACPSHSRTAASARNFRVHPVSILAAERIVSTASGFRSRGISSKRLLLEKSEESEESLLRNLCHIPLKSTGRPSQKHGKTSFKPIAQTDCLSKCCSLVVRHFWSCKP
jgi:hypothetical protein